MAGYSTREVARLLGLGEGRVRGWARAGLVRPGRGARGGLRFSFQDVVLLRVAKELCAARIPMRKVRRALARLRDQLPKGRPLTAVRIAADGDRVVVRDGRARWHPESGQTLLDFEAAPPVRGVAPLGRRAARSTRAAEPTLGAEDWYDLGYELEASDVDRARDAYRRTIELDPHHGDAHINLGRMLHEAGEPRAAEAHYRLALAARPDDATAWFNLGVALEDLGREADAARAYEKSLAAEPGHADARYNLARLRLIPFLGPDSLPT